ncbi:cytochrome P450 [Amycolatopsis pithecellobii]|uniref:Cytochrome P450 n=1 Tax=Amycolatopsis pithecellobii TaxID=664692 RepID=A0A6N7YY75_9PSEU|nr:cytochrome P450 [Amycolatopsis pithecellobii]MTD52381.1 cytochrome P450 [Amycolatopsis pithecellobii]
MTTTQNAIGPSEALGTLFTPSGKRNPYPLYEALRELGPVVKLGPKLVFAQGHDACTDALREPGLLVTDASVHSKTGMLEHSSWQCFTKIMMFSNGTDHDRLRTFSRWAYNPQSITGLRSTIEDKATGLAQRLTAWAGDPVDLVEEFSSRLTLAVTGELYGIPLSDQLMLRSAIANTTTAFEPVFDLSELADGDAGMDVLVDYMAGLADSRRREPRDDVATRMVHEADATGTVTSDELVAGLVMFLIAGVQSPSDLIAGTIRMALLKPAEWQAADAEAFVTEVLRFDAPSQVLTRVAGCDVVLAGVPVAEGARVMLLLAAANRDPSRYDEPDVFRPHRSPNRPLSFGFGMHYCLGAQLARMQAEIGLTTLAHHFPHMTLEDEPRYRDQLVQRGLARLPVRLRPR